MTSERPTCGAKGTINRWGKPCRSPFISKVTGLCRSHDPGQVNRVQEQRSRGGHRSRSSRLSKRMQQLVEMLFKDTRAAPTLERIKPEEFNDEADMLHVLRIDGQRAVLNGGGPHGLHCTESLLIRGRMHYGGHYDCQDKSLFARAMRILRIIKWKNPDGTVSYFHTDTGREIPASEIAKVTQLVKERA